MSEAESESTVTAEECVRTAQSGLPEYTESESNKSAVSESETAILNLFNYYPNHPLNL